MDKLKIYVDRLKHGEKSFIKETIPPEIFGIQEEDLSMQEPVAIDAEAYITDDHLVVHADITTAASMPCAICNTSVALPIVIKSLYLTYPLDEIKTSTSIDRRNQGFCSPPIATHCRVQWRELP